MKRIILVFLSVIMIIGLLGCNNSQNEGPATDLPKENESDKGITINDIKFEKVKLEDLEGALKEVIEQNKMEKGYKLLDDISSEYKYLAVFAGQKPSAGYEIEITKVVDNEGVTDVTVKETSPKEGEMVAEVLTYPIDIVRLTGISDNINLIYEKGKSDAEEQDSELTDDLDESTSMLATTYVEGEYVGQIDSNSIEVKIEDGPQAFRLTDRSKEELSSYKEGDIIGFDYFENEQGQNVIVSIKQEKQFVIGYFVGQIDPHSIEVIIEDGPVVFQLNDAAVEQAKNFEKDDLIKIEYVKNENNQMVANELIKVEK